jgi:hypothetical protein
VANQEMFDKVLQRISDHPESLDMSYWAQRSSCGTVACIAGHTVLAMGYQFAFQPFQERASLAFITDRFGSAEYVDIRERARDALGLTDIQADFMFTCFNIGDENHAPKTVEELTMRWKYVLSKDWTNPYVD